MVRFAALFDPKEKAVTFLSGETHALGGLRAMGMGALLDAMFDFSEKLGTLGLDAQEMALFMAVVLVSAGGRALRGEWGDPALHPWARRRLGYRSQLSLGVSGQPKPGPFQPGRGLSQGFHK